MRKLIIFAVIGSCLMTVMAAATSMDQYCQTPPFLKQAIKPNLLLMLDNSASMYDLAYNSNTTSYCYDNGASFSSSNTYAGYFDSTKKYVYNENLSNNIFQGSTDMFVETTTVPLSCDYAHGTAPGYNVCIKKSGTNISTFYATGNFLNWLSASKFDIQKQTLTGGKYDSTDGVLVGESRGCNGRRFVKTLPGMGITFAVRGPNAIDLETNYDPTTQGGLSRIEIYLSQNADIGQCQQAIIDWSGGSYGQAQTETKSCLQGGTNDATKNQLNQLNQSMQDCWKLKDNIKSLITAGTTPTKANVFQGVDINSSTNNCLQIYKDLCQINGSNCANGQVVGDSIAAIPMENASYWQCTNNASHLPPTAGYNVYGSDAVGFLGRCADIGYTLTPNKVTVDWDSKHGPDCKYEEVLHYCYANSAAEVIDPTQGGSVTYQNSGNLPAILMDSSVLTLGTAGGTFFVRVKQPLDSSSNTIIPTGLIQEFSSKIRFGTMKFNNIGNATESATVPGTVANNLDGSKILTYMTDTVGDHSSGLIASIDDLVASSWTPFAEAYYNAIGYFASNSALMINSDDFVTDPSPCLYSCQKNNVLLITEGISTADQAPKLSDLVTPYNNKTAFGPTNSQNCTYYAGSKNLDFLAWLAKNVNIQDIVPIPDNNDPPLTAPSIDKESIMTHVVYTGKVGTVGTDECDPYTLMYKTAENGGTTLNNASTPEALNAAIYNTFSKIASQSSSGTAISVLSSSEGSGANLVQSLFYPNRSFPSSPTPIEITWTSDVMNYWYYFDPYLSSSQIRENTVKEGSDYSLLDLKGDYIVNFTFNTSSKEVMAHRCQDTVGKGTCGTAITPDIRLEDTRALWRAGVDLWWTNPTDRTIWTSLEIDDPTIENPEKIFFEAGTTTLYEHLGLSAAGADATIDYVRGSDQNKLCSISRKPCSVDTDCETGGGTCAASRNRTVPMNVCSLSKMPCSTVDTPCSTGVTGDTCVSETHTWKLGDVISSTPRIMGPSPTNKYHIASPGGYGDKTYYNFVNADVYKDRRRVFVGSNDGMFHAFRLGKLLQKWTTPAKEWYQVAKIEGPSGVDSAGGTRNGIGTESWAFIPKNVLPYLQYLSQPDYCHIYSVDGPVTLVDASIKCNSSPTREDYWNCTKETANWSSIVMGSMGTGGATNQASDTTDSVASTTCATNNNCIKTPLSVDGAEQGWSSYFALDVTNQDLDDTDPDFVKPLWEFSNANLIAKGLAARLGTTNVGPAIIKVGGKKQCSLSPYATCSTNDDCGTDDTCAETNGRWFAILASGSTGPIDTAIKAFMGNSNQNLWLFVLDLNTGVLVRAIDTGIANAYAGSMSNGAIDIHKGEPSSAGFYQDDALYIGYVQNTTNGGVLRLAINNDITPDNWTVSPVIKDIGPVTTSIVNLLDKRNRKLWLYFAEGRYSYKLDDLSTPRRLFGIQDPCYQDDSSTTLADYGISPSCTTSLAIADFKDQTESIGALEGKTGWFVTLDAETSAMGTERVISNPTPDPLGAIYFLSFAPVKDVCGYGGTTYLWALDYATGGVVGYIMQGKALVQVSTGEIKELDLSDDDTFKEKLNRRTEGFQGVPPAGQGLLIITNPAPLKQFMHVQEQ